MDIVAATRGYEDWLAAALPAPLYRSDLDYKHEQMADPADPFPFFRGTYYRWAQLWIHYSLSTWKTRLQIDRDK